MISFETLREVMLENRAEVMNHRVVKRDIDLSKFDRQVLVGVRRAGKSYLLYGRMQQLLEEGHTWDEMLYLNFEDERLLGMEQGDLNRILEVHASLSPQQPMLFLDEVQNVEGWEHFARRLADRKYVVYITGSNARMLSVDVAATLGGRYFTHEVFPLSFAEYLSIHGLDAASPLLTATTDRRGEVKRLYEEYFRFGGFPECALMAAKRDYLTSIYQKIFLGDIAARHRIENIFALKVLFRKMAESVKQPLSFTRAANIVSSTGTKIGKSTVINYLGYAIDAYLVVPVYNMADGFVARETNPKYYFVDNGILTLLALDVRTSLLESIVALKLFSVHGTHNAVFFYNHGVEVDFYIPDTGTAVQVSYSLHEAPDTRKRELGALEKMAGKMPVNRAIVVTYDEEDVENRDGMQIAVIPAWKFLLDYGKDGNTPF